MMLLCLSIVAVQTLDCASVNAIYHSTSDHDSFKTQHNGTSTKDPENCTVLAASVHMPEADWRERFEETAQSTKGL